MGYRRESDRRYDGRVDTPESAPAVGPACPWCSATLTSAEQPTCPSCGANLHGDPEAEIEGVTALDADTRMRLGLVQRAASPPPRRGLLAWSAPEAEPELGLDAETLAILGDASVEPPSADVRREMLRLEMEALQRELEAANAAAIADADVDDIRAAQVATDPVAGAAEADGSGLDEITD